MERRIPKPADGPMTPSGGARCQDARLRREAASVLVVLVLLAVALAVTTRTHISLSPVTRQSADSFNEIVLRQSGGQLSFEIAVGLRQDAGSRLEDLRIPNRRHVVTPGHVLSRQILRLLLRGRVTVADYDPRIDDQCLRRMLGRQPVRHVGDWGQVYLVGPASTRYVLRTDSQSKSCYIVPAEVDRQLGAWTGPPLPPGEGLLPYDAELP